MQPTDLGAKCALHPTRAASGTCRRCGNFGCLECLSLTGQCPTCAQLTGDTGFPFTKDAFAFDAVFGFAFEKWKREWVMLAVAFLIVLVSQWMGGLISNLMTLGINYAVTDRIGGLTASALRMSGSVSNNLLGTAVAGIFQMGFVKIGLDVLRGQRADVGQILSQYRKLGRYLLHYAITIVVTGGLAGVWFLGTALAAMVVMGTSITGGVEQLFDRATPVAIALLVLSGLALFPVLIFFWTHYVLGVAELVDTECGPIDAIRRAYQMTAGVRLRAMAYPTVAGVLMVAGVFACCIGLFPAAGLAQLLTGALFLTLRGARST